MFDPSEKIYLVGELNLLVRGLLETRFADIRITGEVSNFSCPASGHQYFTLKDENGQIRCAFFRNRNRLGRFRAANGDHVVARGKVSLYEPRGDYQFIVEALTLAGEGELQRRFEALKQRLFAEGLFAPEHKKSLPRFPRQLGVITSPSGAAVRDVLQVLARRYPALPVIIYPVQVQGDDAARQIATALELAAERAECDVLLLTRGGGSLEDLWSFNEEIVARAVFDCPLPVVAAIGHEIDFTIADYVADVRAPTPSAAAELLTPDVNELRAQLAHQRSRLANAATRLLQHQRQRVEPSRQLLRALHPRARIETGRQRADECLLRLQRQFEQLQHQRRTRVLTLDAALPGARIRDGLGHQRQHVAQLIARLAHALQSTQARSRQSHANLHARLTAVDVQAVLGRGFAIVTAADGTEVIRDAQALAPGDRFRVRLARGEIIGETLEIHAPQPKSDAR
ncbi:MAG: exodeoxyribonuclease VII large subunit [Thiotrichales bacterium]